MTHDPFSNAPDEARLQRAMDRAAHPETGGDWNAVLRALDERQTSTPARRWWRGVIAGAAVLGAGAWAVVVVRGPHGSVGPSPGAPVVQTLSVSNDQSAIDAVDLMRIRGGDLVLGKGVVQTNIGGGEEVFAPLNAYAGPFAVSTIDGPSAVILPTWKSIQSDGQTPEIPAGRPSLRVLQDGQSQVLARGGLSPALSRSGRLAYAVGIDPVFRPNRSYQTRIMVGSLGSETTTRWTTKPGTYFPVAWAGDRLIAYEQFEGEERQVLIFSGPNRFRRLTDVGGLIAVSPDGRQIAVTDSISTVQIVDVASGATVARLQISEPDDGTGTTETSTGPGAAGLPSPVMAPGSWRGSQIVVAAGDGLAVLTVDGSSLWLAGRYPTPTLPYGIDGPIWIDDDTVVGRADIAQLPDPNTDGTSSGLVVCHLSKRSCATGDVTEKLGEWSRWVQQSNP